MLNVSEIASSTEERVLTSVKAGQALVLDGVKSSIALADRVIPDQVSDRIEERVATIPSATPLVDGAFDFAAKLLAAQRDFAAELIEILQPTVATAPRKTAPTKTGGKKSSAKKSSAKKSSAKKAA